jgi:hypothetical protein
MPIPRSGWFVHAIAHPHLVRNCLPTRTCGWGLLPIFICTANNCYYLGSQSQRIGPVLATTKSQILRRIWELGPHLQGLVPNLHTKATQGRYDPLEELHSRGCPFQLFSVRTMSSHLASSRRRDINARNLGCLLRDRSSGEESIRRRCHVVRSSRNTYSRRHDHARWGPDGWDEARQAHILSILGERAVPVVWDAE